MALYTTRSGDTLASLAARHHTTVAALARSNRIANPDLLEAGRTLVVPDRYTGTTSATAPVAARSYTVRAGDSLSEIAARFDTTSAALATRNGLRDPRRIFPGQRLSISGASTPPSPTTATSWRVRRGDTLGAIAARWGTTSAAVADANGLTNPNRLREGMVLRAPSVREAPRPTGQGVTLAQLQAIMPELGAAKARRFLPLLNEAMAEGQINTPRRKAAFLAQMAHESHEFLWFEELASGADYEGRADLGNVHPGDGVRFKGRGPLQLTGRENYEKAGRDLGLDLVRHPEQVATPEVGFRTSQWFWNHRDLNRLADARDFDAITAVVNGGFEGRASRNAYHARALRVLGA